MKIKLGGKNGGFAIVSKEDYDDLSKYSWHMTDEGYVCGKVNGISIRMHHYVMNADKHDLVDHINKIRHDNRRENLRFSDYGKNAQNRKVNKDGKSSKYRGVSYYKQEKKYMTKIGINKKRIYLGLHENETDAAEAFDMYVVHNKLDHIDLNFPDKKEIYRKREYIPYQSKKINQTIYRGVNKTEWGYTARITINKKKIHIGASKDLITCAKLWDKYVVNNNILNRELNFPQDYPNYETRMIKTKCEVINDKIVRLILNKYPDKNVFIDKDDYNKIKYYSWHITPKGYVKGNVNGIKMKINRFIMDITDPYIYVDHIDSNPLNNIRSNLRISNSSKNSQNKKKQQNTTSNYLGIWFNKKSKKWQSLFIINYTKHYLGEYKDEEEAARRRDLYILDNYPDEHYKLNFEWTDDDINEWKIKFNLINKKTKYRQLCKRILLATINDDIDSVGNFNSLLNDLN